MNRNRKLSVMTAIMAIALLATPVLARQGEGMQSASPERQKMQAEMAKSYEENEQIREQIQKLETKSEAIVRAATFDKAAFIAKRGEVESLRAKMVETRVKAEAEAFSKMSAEERAKMMDEFKNRRHHRMGNFPDAGRGPGPSEDTSESE